MGESEVAVVVQEDAERVAWLVRGLREAEPQAQAELCERFGPRLHRYLVHRLGQRDDVAEDLMVQTLVDAARNASRYDARKATFLAWLLGIARRQAQLELRRRLQGRSVPAAAQTTLESLAEQSAPGDVAEAVTSRIEAKRQISKLVGYLSEIELEVLTLRCLQQLSVKEIGQVLGRSERAIDSLLHRAKQKARERLADDAGTV